MAEWQIGYKEMVIDLKSAWGRVKLQHWSSIVYTSTHLTKNTHPYTHKHSHTYTHKQIKTGIFIEAEWLFLARQ